MKYFFHFHPCILPALRYLQVTIVFCNKIISVRTTFVIKGAFKYYVIKEVGGWVGQMMMFDDKVGGWEWLNDDVIKKYTRKKNFSSD